MKSNHVTRLFGSSRCTLVVLATFSFGPVRTVLAAQPGPGLAAAPGGTTAAPTSDADKTSEGPADASTETTVDAEPWATDISADLDRFKSRSFSTVGGSWAPSAQEVLIACSSFSAVVDRSGLVLPGPAVSCGDLPKIVTFCEDPTTGDPVRSKTIIQWRDQLRGTVLAKALASGDDPSISRACETTAAALSTESQNVAGPLSLGPGLQDALVRGVAAFVSARLKAELELMVQERIADDLCTKGVTDHLLPSSCRLARQMRGDEAPLAWGSIRAALQKDLEALPVNILPMLISQLGKSPGATDEGKAAIAVLGTVPVLLGRLGEHGTPLADLGELGSLFDDGTIEHQVLLGASVAIQAVTPRKGNPLLASKDFERFGKIAASVVTNELDLNLDPDQLSDLGERLITLRLKAENLYLRLQAAQKARTKGETPDPALYADLAVKTIALLIASGDLALALPIKELDDKKREKLQSGLKLAPALAEAITAGQARDYTALLNASLTIVAGFEDDLGVQMPDALKVTLQQYGPFLVELASAEDAEEVERALEAAAAPVGSYKVKRGWKASLAAARMRRRIETGEYSLDEKERKSVELEHTQTYAGRNRPRRPLTVSLNAFAGASAGGEWLLGSGFTPEQSRAGGHAGLFMPVGIDVALGVGAASSLQIFTSIIDVGALGDFRFGGDETGDSEKHVESEAEPHIGFAQVFSPGMYFVYGIHRTPLALGAGASYAAQYRRTSLDPAVDPVDLRSTLQVSGFVAVDIPVFVIFRRGGLKRSTESKSSK